MDRLSPMLESSALGRHLLAAEDATTVRSLLTASANVTLPDDETTDIGPLIQQAYDDGAEVLRLVSGRTYLWDSPVFLDQGGAMSGFVIEGNRARIKLGGNLPRTDWARDASTRFAVFPNTKRSALSGGAVTVSSATRATGPTAGALRPLTIRDLIIDGNGTNAGFSFANQAAVTFDQVTLWRARVGATWVGYSDGNTFIACYSRYGSAPAQQVLVEQISAGDGLVILGGKADTPVDFARLKNCRGAVIQGVVTARMTFEECSGIVLQGSHFEGQESTRPMITIRNSQVTMTGVTVYETYDPKVGGILIDDSSSNLSCSEVTLQDCTAMQLITPAQRATTYSPFVILGQTRLGTRLTARGLQGRYAASGTPGRWRDTVQPAISSLKSKRLTKALNSHIGRAALASGDFQIRRGTSGWEVRGAVGPLVSRRQGPPTLGTVTNNTGMTNAGELRSGQRYSYVVAVQDAFGHYSKRSRVLSATANGGRLIGLQIMLATSPGVLVIWRSRGGDPVKSPDAYIRLPTRAALVNLFDSGDHIAGRSWWTTDIPSPSVASKNRTLDALVVGTKAITS